MLFRESKNSATGGLVSWSFSLDRSETWTCGLLRSFTPRVTSVVYPGTLSVLICSYYPELCPAVIHRFIDYYVLVVHICVNIFILFNLIISSYISFVIVKSSHKFRRIPYFYYSHVYSVRLFLIYFCYRDSLISYIR